MILEHMFPLRESRKNKQPFRKNPNYLPQVVLGLERYSKLCRNAYGYK